MYHLAMTKNQQLSLLPQQAMYFSFTEQQSHNHWFLTNIAILMKGTSNKDVLHYFENTGFINLYLFSRNNALTNTFSTLIQSHSCIHVHCKYTKQPSMFIYPTI